MLYIRDLLPLATRGHAMPIRSLLSIAALAVFVATQFASAAPSAESATRQSEGNSSVLRSQAQRQPTAAAEETQTQAAPQAISPEARVVVQEMTAIQQRFQQEEQLLQRRLAEAQRALQRGVSENNYSLIQQAEQYQQQALNNYEQRIRQLEQWSRNYAEQKAGSTMNHPNMGTTNQPSASNSQRRSYSPQPTSNRSSRSGLFRRR